MDSKKLLVKFSIIVVSYFFCNSSFAEVYNYETSKKIIMKGEILHAGVNKTGAHTFTVAYKGNLYFCAKSANWTRCFD